MLRLALTAVLCLPALSQQSVTVTIPTVTDPAVMVIMPVTGPAFVRLDTATLDLAIINGKLSLRSKALPIPHPVLSYQMIRAPAPGSPWTLPTGCQLIMLVRNIPQHSGLDFSLSGSTINWLVTAPTPTDAVWALCQRSVT